MEEIDAIIAELQEHNGETFPPWIVFNEDGGIDVTLFIDRIKSAVKALESDRDNWRRQALDEDARANATCKDPLQVGNAAKMREALEEFVKYSELVQRMGIFVRDSLVKITTKAREALAKPPRNCDMMSLDDARKVWFLNEIMPRLDGKLPLGKEKPFDEWFVSQHEEGE